MFYTYLTDAADPSRSGSLATIQTPLPCFNIICVCFQVDRAVPMFNKYRRYGHKFNVNVYNCIVHGLAEKVTWYIYVQARVNNWRESI